MPSEKPPARWSAADSSPTSIEDLLDPIGGDAAQRRHGPEVVPGGAAGVHAAWIEHDAHRPGRVPEVGVADAVVADLAGIGPGEPDHHAHGGRLAGPVGSDEPGDPAGGDGEGQVVDRGAVAVVLGESGDGDHDVAPGGLLGSVGCGVLDGLRVRRRRPGRSSVSDTSGMPRSRSVCSRPCRAAWSTTGPRITVVPSSSGDELEAVEPRRPACGPRRPRTRISYRGDPCVAHEGAAGGGFDGVVARGHLCDRTNDPGEPHITSTGDSRW